MKVFKVGLTGGIGAGKSTVAQMLEEKGAVVYDCDTRAKELMITTLKQPLTELLGKDAFDDSGNLCRAYIASVIFKDPSKLKAVNELVHPAVDDDFNHFVQKVQSAIDNHGENTIDNRGENTIDNRGETKIDNRGENTIDNHEDSDNTPAPLYIIKEAAILIESGASKGLDMIVVVTAPMELRIVRVVARDGVTPEDVKKRISAQMPQEKLIEFANYVISTDATDKKYLLEKVEKLHQTIISKATQRTQSIK